jgi:hypothetical protein
METRHVKFNYDQALDAKKQLLSSEINLLHMVRALKAYNMLRKKEFAEKNKLKINLTSIKTKINLLNSNLPKPAPMPKAPTRIKGIKKHDKKTLQQELKEIKEKLEGLK